MPNYIISFLESKMKGSTCTIVFLLFTLCTFAQCWPFTEDLGNQQAETNLAMELEDCVQACADSETPNVCVEVCKIQNASKMAIWRLLTE